MNYTYLNVTALMAILAAASLQPAKAQCEPHWQQGNGIPGVDGVVNAFTTWDRDGAGPLQPLLVVGGDFEIAGNVYARNIAAFDGTNWFALGSGVEGGVEPVRALAAFDDGSGSALYAAGDFTFAGGGSAHRVAKWDGAAWHQMHAGFPQTVRALTVFDYGSGPALYAAGDFEDSATVPMYHVARWNGTSWSALTGGAYLGTDDEISALLAYDNGDGPALYLGGEFVSAGSVYAHGIVRWDGTTWTTLGSGMNSGVRALAGFDDGDGPALYAGGNFTTAGGVSASRIAKWDGMSWSPLGAGMTSGIPTAGVFALAAFDDGSGPALFAGGEFRIAGGIAANRMARWDGTNWSPLGGGMGNWVRALTVHSFGNGPRLIAGGEFGVNGPTIRKLASWDGTSWAHVGTGTNNGLSYLGMLDPGSGLALYAAGSFGMLDGTSANHVARWNGTSWVALGAGTDGRVYDLAAGAVGGSSALYAGGSFDTAGGIAADSIAKWDGVNWVSLASDFNSSVLAVEIFDAGAGAALYVGGGFTNATGPSGDGIVKWDGTTWSTVGSGVGGRVDCLTIFDDGSGPALIAGGGFSSAGGVPASRVAKWDGSNWSALGSGLGGPLATSVRSLMSYDDGTGPALYAGGTFTSTGGVGVGGIARWNGVAWAPLSAEAGSPAPTSISALAVLDDASGRALVAGGRFESAGQASVDAIGRWNGARWLLLPGSFDDSVNALGVSRDGARPVLHIGGSFTDVNGSLSAYYTRWTACPGLPGDVNCDVAVNFLDIDPFILALFDPGAYATAFPSCSITRADVNADARVDFLDIDPFVACLFGVCP